MIRYCREKHCGLERVPADIPISSPSRSKYFNVPATSVMAGTIFEAIAHRALCKASCSNAVAASSDGEVQVMHSYEGGTRNAPTFSTAIPPSPFGTSVSPPSIPLLNSGREVCSINLSHDLNDFWQADNKKYYIPTASNNPFLDSFTITIDPSQTTARISVFQITIAKTHLGSDKGYAQIRNIMHCVRKLNPGFTVTVEYWLVCPASDSPKEWTWRMPNGWDTNATVNDHRGHVFCLRIPVVSTPPTG